MKKVFIFTYADDNKKVLTEFTQLWDEINNKEIINEVKGECEKQFMEDLHEMIMYL